MASSNKRALTGLVLVLVGTLLLLDNLGLAFDLPRYLFTWPLILVAIGLVNAFSGNFRAATILLGLGVLFYLDRYDFIDIKTLWPLFLIVAGLAYLLKNRERTRKSEENNDFIDEVSIFSGTEKKYTSDKLKGGKITSIFGGSEIDLRGSKAEHGAVIEVFTLFGGCDIYVPSDWKLDVDTVAIFGGFADSRSNINPASTATVRIKGFTMFGGGEVKN